MPFRKVLNIMVVFPNGVKRRTAPILWRDKGRVDPIAIIELVKHPFSDLLILRFAYPLSKSPNSNSVHIGLRLLVGVSIFQRH